MSHTQKSLVDKISAALSRRQDSCRSTSVCRLFDAEGISELFIDRYGSLAVSHLLPEDGKAHKPIIEEFKTALESLKNKFIEDWGITTFYLRVHPKDSRKQRSLEPILLWGESTKEYEVTEGANKFIIRPEDSLHAGLYTDMREVRSWLTENSTGKRVLNLFSFTGSLGVAAVTGGAAEVCQIDSSPTAVEWSKKNFALNQREMTMRIQCDDCRHFLDREIARVVAGGKRTDIILLDPPSFGRGRKRTFAIKRDLEELVEKGMRILSANGVMVLTSNSRALDAAQLKEVAEGAATKAGWTISHVEELSPPASDFFASGHQSIAMRGVRIFGAS